VSWTQQVARDGLSPATRNSLGAILTLFRVSSDASAELLDAAVPLAEPLPEDAPRSAPSRPSVPTRAPASRAEVEFGDEAVERGTEEDSGGDAELEGVLDKAGDLIDDRLMQLDWDEMQELVAGVLRAMGYRTQVAAAGPDRGVDIFASPDGLGLEEPRVFVEVKHRRASMGAAQVRAFLGGRQTGDRCLYVSTGGFTREARYEAERSTIPVTLIDLPRLRALLLDYYDRLDPATSALVPLQRMYWPLQL
jgi:restriction system protein